MSTFIKLDKQDAYITSYTAYKNWIVNSSSLDEYGIEVYHAYTSSYLSEGLFNPNSSAIVGSTSVEYSSLLYESIKHLYYEGVYTGAETSSSYEDYKQTTLHPSTSRALGNEALIVSIPQDTFGSAIKPGTFYLGSSIPLTSYVSGGFVMTGYFVNTGGTDYNIYDNGEGVLLESGSLRKVGDIIYPHGLAIITDTGSISSILNLTGSCTTITTCPTSSYVAVSYVSGAYFTTEDCTTSTYYVHPAFVANGYFVSGSSSITGSASTSCTNGYNVLWQSTYDIYTHNYRCTVREQDLNYTHNQTVKSGSNGDVYDFVTGSYFQPYITTVGLYNDSDELIAIGKLSQPIPKSRYTDMTFVVKLDM